MVDDKRIVGEFGTSRRTIVRSPKNPLDKATIVSIFPKDINERKYTIEPGIFSIKAGTLEAPSLLVVGGSSWWSDRGEENQPILEIPVNSVQVAESVIGDYCRGLVGCDMVDCIPGVFYIPGTISKVTLSSEYKTKLAEVKAKQDNWYRVLVTMADALWARTNGNPLVICDEMRLAARSLNLNDKTWLQDYNIIEMVKCVACGALKNPAYPVCATCKAIDMTHPQAKDLKFAS